MTVLLIGIAVILVAVVVTAALLQRQEGDGFLQGVTREAAMTLLATLIVGVISGVAFRVVLRILAWVDAEPGTTFTLSGSLAVVAIVTVFGAPLGFLFVVARHVLPGSGWRQGLIYGMLLLLYPGIPYLFIPPDQANGGNSLLFGIGNSDFFEPGYAPLVPAVLSRVLCAACLLGYGVLMGLTVPRLERILFGTPARSAIYRPAIVILVLLLLLASACGGEPANETLPAAEGSLSTAASAAETPGIASTAIGESGQQSERVADPVVAPEGNTLAALDPATGAARWTVQPEADADHHPRVAGDAVYLQKQSMQGDPGALTAYDAASGAERWQIPLSSHTYPSVADDTAVYVFGPDDALTALDPATGSARWSAAGLTPGAAGGGTVYALDNSGGLHALDAATGQERWSQPVIVKWAPVATDDTVYVAASGIQGASDRAVALDAATGAERWSFEEPGAMLILIGAADGNVYVAAGDLPAEVIALDAATGAERWRTGTTVSGITPDAFAVGDGAIYLFQDELPLEGDGRLVAVEAATGATRWEVAAAPARPSFAGGLVVVIAGEYTRDAVNNTLLALDPATGQQRWTIDDIGAIVHVTGDAESIYLAVWMPVMPAVPESPPSTGQVIGQLAFAHGGPASMPPGMYLVNDDGSGLERLPIDVFGTSPSWSPDGQRIVVVQPGGDSLSKLFTVNVDGSGLHELIEDGLHPAWSPTGEQIAFVRGDYDIFVVNSDGSDLRQLTSGTRGDGAPVWSPDGQHVAFASADAQGVHSIHVIRADGSEERLLASMRSPWSTSEAYEGQPVWSPDGRQLAFIASDPRDRVQVWAVNVDGSELRVLTDEPRGAGQGDEGFGRIGLAGLDWSPDGERIAFTTYRDGDAEIYVMSADGSDLRNLTNNPEHDDVSPVWSPGGERIAYLSQPADITLDDRGFDTWSLRAIDTDGANGQILVEEVVAPALAWRPPGNGQ